MEEEKDPYVGHDLLGGQIKVLRPLAEHGLVKVYAAYDSNLNRTVTFKIPRDGRDDDQIDSFRREEKILRRLTHPGTIKMLGAGTLDVGVPYILLEHFGDHELADVLRKEGPFVVDRAIRIVLQICDALKEIHALGVVHLGVSPGAVVLFRDDEGGEQAKLTGFTLARISGESEGGKVTGNPGYMSPEQAAGKILDPRSDTYTLAVSLYELLTGRLPYDGAEPHRLMIEVMFVAPIPLDDRVPGKRFPPGLGAIIARALEKSPNDRYASIAEFAEALKPFAAPAPEHSGQDRPPDLAPLRAHVDELAKPMPPMTAPPPVSASDRPTLLATFNARAVRGQRLIDTAPPALLIALALPACALAGYALLTNPSNVRLVAFALILLVVAAVALSGKPVARKSP